jgi:glutamate N-acetyltransferase/amino-acid N-acetyltransferase
MKSLPKGFRAGAVAAGLKSNGNLDLTIIENLGPRFDAAAVFTSNQVVAAPVMWSREVLKEEFARAVVLNSGGANACTGSQGFADTHHTAEKVADLLKVSAGEVVVCSTGLIGELLPMPKILAGLETIAQSMSSESLDLAARAIMTTDSVPKIATQSLRGVEFAGIAKGAGMLAPALATMLSVVMTDGILPTNIQSIFKRVVDRTFNRIDSDGCTSTNDTVLLMGSGASGIELTEAECETALADICGSLARQLIDDAEGSTKSVEIYVRGAKTEGDAVAVARACARNNLLKCAIFGGDPNWGRVLAAVGTAQAFLDPLTIDVVLNGVHVAKNSAPYEDKSLVSFADRVVTIEIDLHCGSEQAVVVTNDLSHDYVHENSAYST